MNTLGIKKNSSMIKKKKKKQYKRKNIYIKIIKNLLCPKSVLLFHPLATPNDTPLSSVLSQSLLYWLILYPLECCVDDVWGPLMDLGSACIQGDGFRRYPQCCIYEDV
uniref:Uncharacterized protein n=1 Tax=Cacopsylla melanoneura TaxID=428564 RepID=A0A8D8R5M9_9HEMI